MAENCPNNVGRTTNPGACKTTMSDTTSTPTTTPTPAPLGLKLTKAQQICTIKESMNDEECGTCFDEQEGQGFLQCQVLKVTESIKVANMYSMKMNSMTIPVCVYMWHELTTIVMLQLGVCLDLRFLRVALVLGFLLLPPVTQMCGKRVF